MQEHEHAVCYCFNELFVCLDSIVVLQELLNQDSKIEYRLIVTRFELNQTVAAKCYFIHVVALLAVDNHLIIDAPGHFITGLSTLFDLQVLGFKLQSHTLLLVSILRFN